MCGFNLMNPVQPENLKVVFMSETADKKIQKSEMQDLFRWLNPPILFRFYDRFYVWDHIEPKSKKKHTY